MPNVKSCKLLENKESRVLGGSRLIYLVIRLGYEPSEIQILKSIF